MHPAARAAVKCRGCGLGRSCLCSRCFFLLVFQHSLLIVSSGLPLGECNGTGGAAGQAVAKAVAVIVPHQLGFAVDKADGSLVAGGDTGTTAIAFFFVYVNDFPDHDRPSF